MSNTGKIPRIELTRERSSTLESIQSFTRAIRESLRLHNVRREKKRRQKKNSKAAAAAGCSSDGGLLTVNPKKSRSKSMDYQDSEYNEEISEVGISAVVLSDIGPITTQQETETVEAIQSPEDKIEEAGESGEATRHRRHSKSVDEVELAHMRKRSIIAASEEAAAVATGVGRRGGTKKQPQMSLDIGTTSGDVGDGGKSKASRQMSMPSNSGDDDGRRKSRDDSDVNKSDAKHLRSRFAHLLEALRAHKFSLSALEEASSNLPTKSEP